MAKSMFIVLAYIAAAYSAAINYEDVPLRRAARSPCATCGGPPYPPPPGPPSPPPPPILHTQNWSGLARTSDGLQNAVFSGAAAAADQGAQTLTLASSAAGVGFEDSAKAGVSANLGAAGLAGSDVAGNKATGESDGISTRDGGYGGQKYVSGGYKESHYSYNSHGGSPQIDRQVAGSDFSSSFGQNSAFGGDNRGDGGFGGQEKDTGFAGSGNSEQFESHGGYHSNHGGHSELFNSASSSAGGNGHFESDQRRESSFGGNGYGQAESGFTAEGQRKEDSSLNYEKDGHYSGFGGYHGGYHGGHHGGFQHNQAAHSGYDKQEAVFGQQNGQLQDSSSFGKANGQFQASANGEQQQSASFTRENEQVPSSGGKFEQGVYGSGSVVGHQAAGSYGGSASGIGRQQQDSASFGKETEQVSGSAGQFEHAGQQAGGYYGASGSGSGDGRAALKGALDLASQGLQTAHQSGCSTCGKNSYALSNAKSWSGSAVALSIGG